MVTRATTLKHFMHFLEGYLIYLTKAHFDTTTLILGTWPNLVPQFGFSLHSERLVLGRSLPWSISQEENLEFRMLN